MAQLTVNQHVVFVNVTLHDYGPTYKYLPYRSTEKADPLTVAVGDQVAWFVRVIDGPAQRLQAYQLTFADPSIFGTGSLSVPSGGFSPYLQVVSLPGTGTKYTLAVQGISPPSDPEIIVNGDGLIVFDRVPAVYVINWQSPNGPMSYTTNGGPSYPFPATLPVIAGDRVTFQVQPQAPFNVVFTGSDHTVGTPFVGNTVLNTVPGNQAIGGVESTVQLTVAVDPDADPNFPFFVASQNADSARSDSFTLSVSNTPIP